jgi:hypothetical protein
VTFQESGFATPSSTLDASLDARMHAACRVMRSGISETAGMAAGIIKAGLPQLPLTTLNSVLAVCQLSGDLFPARQARPIAVSASVGVMNLVGVWFGAMPCCHGSGGMAAQVCLHLLQAATQCPDLRSAVGVTSREVRALHDE